MMRVNVVAAAEVEVQVSASKYMFLYYQMRILAIFLHKIKHHLC